MAVVAVRAALMAVHVKQHRLMAMAQVVVAHCLVAVVADLQAEVREVVVLVAQSVLFTPVTHANSRQLM